MSTILNKKQMTEEDIKLQYITPAITAKWDIGHITMETKITDSKVNIKGNLVFREKPKKADYVLYINANNPIATGIYEIEKTDILKLDPFLKMGKPSKIAGYFSGKEGYLKAVKELEDEIYNIG